MRGHRPIQYPPLALWLLAAALLGAAPLDAQIPRDEYAVRRAALAEGVQEGILLAVGSAQPPEDYVDFHQNSPFRYVTGFREPDAVLLGLVSGGELLRETLFVTPRDPAQETWEGYRTGPDGAREVTGIRGRPLGELGSVLDSLASAGWDQVHVVGPYDPTTPVANDVTQRVSNLFADRPGFDVSSLTPEVDALRSVKSRPELALMRKAVDITSLAHRELMRVLEPGMNEFELEALLEHTFRRYGSERPAFSSIVGSGPNATVLHYNANDRFMEAGEVVVIDIGASYGGYAADVTRTLPVSGRFTPEQTEIYEVVRAAQRAAEEIAAPGVSQREMAQAATTVLAEGLADLGLIEAASATYQDASGQEYPQYFLYYMHALSHGLGLDVHDPWPSAMEPGVAFTIEPGIYVRPNLFTEVVPDTPRNQELRRSVQEAFDRYVNIGIRIEDDYIITESGVERISSAPREIEEIEQLMSEPWNGPLPRDEEWVEWYRATP